MVSALKSLQSYFKKGHVSRVDEEERDSSQPQHAPALGTWGQGVPSPLLPSYPEPHKPSWGERELLAADKEQMPRVGLQLQVSPPRADAEAEGREHPGRGEAGARGHGMGSWTPRLTRA